MMGTMTSLSLAHSRTVRADIFQSQDSRLGEGFEVGGSTRPEVPGKQDEQMSSLRPGDMVAWSISTHPADCPDGHQMIWALRPGDQGNIPSRKSGVPEALYYRENSQVKGRVVTSNMAVAMRV